MSIGGDFVYTPRIEVGTQPCVASLLEYRRIMAGIVELADPWSGPLAPKISPALIPETSPTKEIPRKDHDPARRRATFGVPYPRWEVMIGKRNDVYDRLPLRPDTTDRHPVPSVRLYLSGPNLFFYKADFRECTFHRRGDHGEESRVLRSTFKNCRFERCMFGGTLFSHVTFERSQFSRCDLSTSEFRECHFIDCTFSDCTCENTSFFATEVDPTAFLVGMPPPVYNYLGPVPDWEQTPAQVQADWVEVRRKLAAQLLRSNTEIHHSRNSDRGLFELKRAEVTAGFQVLRTQPLNGFSRLLRRIQCCTAWVVLKLTKGGTSLSRLLLSATFFILLYALLLSNSHVTFMNQDCHLHSFQLSLVFQQLARATSLFLAIGYTAFSGGALATVLLTAASSVGLLWYALVADVVIHRVYR